MRYATEALTLYGNSPLSGPPLVVHIPRDDVVEIAMVYSGDVLIAPDVGGFWATIKVSGTR